jgi:hypothetical protein
MCVSSPGSRWFLLQEVHPRNFIWFALLHHSCSCLADGPLCSPTNKKKRESEKNRFAPLAEIYLKQMKVWDELETLTRIISKTTNLRGNYEDTRTLVSRWRV